MQDQAIATPTIDTYPDTGPIITVSFPVQGRHLPADHGYALYSSISRQLPEAHHAAWFGIELISGIPFQPRIITLPTRGAALRLRIPATHFAHILPLAGKRLSIEGHTIRLGIPTARPLTPASSLYARIVTIKKFTEAKPLLEAAYRQLEMLRLKATLEIPRDEEGRAMRRILRIQGKIVVGFSLAAHNLSDEDSVKLQSTGLGGRRSMGCGHFNPIVSCERFNNLKRKDAYGAK